MTPLTDQQLAELQAIADRHTTDPFFVSDCDGSLQVWREKALVHVRRDEAGVIDMYSFPSSYRPTDQVIELDLDSWDPGEDPADDQRRQDIGDLVDARAAMGGLLDEIGRLSAELAAYEPLTPQQCPAGKHADWLVDSEYAHACPWCEIERLRARALTASEYNAAWHAVEGTAGQEGADPGTILHAVLDRLGIAWQDAARPAAAVPAAETGR